MHAAPAPHPASTSPPTSGFAIASLILSLTAWLVLPVVGAMAGVVLGHLARGEIRRGRGDVQGDGLAVAGLIIGYLHLGLCLLGVGFLLLLFAGVLGAGWLY